MNTATNTQAQTPITSQIRDLRHTPLAELAGRDTDRPTDTAAVGFNSSI